MKEPDSKDIDTKDFDSKDFGSEDLDELVVLGESRTMQPEEERPIPFDNTETEANSISHAPLNLDGSSMPSLVEPVSTDKTTGDKSSPDRITHIKTFFSKLHAGSLDFLDQQVDHWLKQNPGIVIKRTNTTVGSVVAKKTEPNIILTIWY
jgi:hypothetical protein